MSSIYVLEPPTKGKVVLKTSCGPLDIEIWSKEAPKACRNFVQLCMEGYYDGTIFHRIIKDFLVQGGDHTGTGTGGDSIYGEPFADEIHTRLKFRHRGFVACANSGAENSNNSQFFITLDRCDWINGKNTIFGKVTGDTIYNLLKLSESETDQSDRPVEAQKILSTEILWNPFDDIVPRNRIKAGQKSVSVQEEKPVKQKKRLNLLSFGEEAQQEEEEVSAVKQKIKSSHDVLDDPRLLKSQDPAPEVDDEKKRKDLSAVRQALAGKSAAIKQPEKEEEKEDEEEKTLSDEEDTTFDAKMRNQLLKKKRRWDDANEVKSTAKQAEEPRKSEEKEADEEDEDEEEESQVRKDRLVIKKHGIGSEAKAEMAVQRDVELQMLNPQEQKRQKIKLNKRNLKGREETTMALLERFRQKLSSAKANPSESETAPAVEGDIEVAETIGWSTHKLKFEVNKKDKMARSDELDHYEVVDPLLEKGKEQFNKMQAKLKRRNREWAGKSYT